MSIERGDTIHLADGEHEVVGVESDAVFIERLSDQAVTRYTVQEAETLISDAQQNGWYTGPWPITTTSYVHDEAWSLNDQLIAKGLSNEDRGKFKHPVYELKLKLELHRDGTVYIVEVADHPLAAKIKCD